MARAVQIGLLAIAVALAPAASGEASSAAHLTLVIRPEVSLESVNGDAVRLRIRLAPGTIANIWAAQESWSGPSSGAGIISRSGTHEFPASNLGNGNYVCLTSSDGILHSSTRRLGVESPTLGP